MKRIRNLLAGVCATICCVAAYEVPVSDTDYSAQVCSGMWGGQNTYINVSFEAESQGQLAMVIYEWSDYEMLGKVTSLVDDTLPKTYVCTSDAVRNGHCNSTELGRFIIDVPEGKSLANTSFWTARLGFREQENTQPASGSNESRENGLWDNPEGNPSPPSDPYTSPWKRSGSRLFTRAVEVRQTSSEPAASILWYNEPIHYEVKRTGYYCVAIVPVTVLSTGVKRQANTDVPFHPSYKGTVLFKNTFDGQLPAGDYPKVNFYLCLVIAYVGIAAAWSWLCFKHKDELLPIQYYLSSLVAFLVVEMVANWAYYRYLNAHGRNTTAATAFLFVVAILDAGRNALSFFMLLVVSLGLSVVKESLGSTMTKCQLLAGAHFVFGVLYAVGIVELELESTSALILLLFVIPLAFTLSGFLLWIMYALNGTIAQLAARKQRYKLTMFRRLYRILLMTVVIIAIFFVVSSLSFSNRLAEDFAANTWKIRWWLLDGWLALLYLVAFAAIAYLWRPTAHNRRLAMSDELAQEDEDAEDYDLEAIESRTRARDDDDDITLTDRRPLGTVGEDTVVFEIGDQDLSDDEDGKPIVKKTHVPQQRQDDRELGEEHERQGLMGNGNAQKDRDD